MKILKDSGEEEIYDKGKFCDSLRDAGAPEGLVTNVCSHVEKDLSAGITTSEIFRRASRILAKENLHVAGRYNLKRGMRELGPAGFLFEQFLEVMLKTLGFTTLRNRIMDGECASHEIDILAKKEDEHYLVEAKYHNARGAKVHIDVIMYADARLEDIYRLQEVREKDQAVHYMWVITNTKFSSKAIKYGRCRGLKMTGWRYPRGESLEDIITKHVLYPVTVLPSIDRESLAKFAKFDMMLARDLVPHTPDDLVRKFDVPKQKVSQIISEASALVYGDT
jgi:Holliday junction resolvase